MALRLLLFRPNRQSNEASLLVLVVVCFSLCCVIPLTDAFHSPLQQSSLSQRYGFPSSIERSWTPRQERTKIWVSGASDQSRTWNLPSRRTTVDVNDRSRSRKKMKPMPVTGYNARAIEMHYDRRPLQVGWRLNSLGFPLLCTCYMASLLWLKPLLLTQLCLDLFHPRVVFWTVSGQDNGGFR